METTEEKKAEVSEMFHLDLDLRPDWVGSVLDTLRLTSDLGVQTQSMLAILSRQQTGENASKEMMKMLVINTPATLSIILNAMGLLGMFLQSVRQFPATNMVQRLLPRLIDMAKKNGANLPEDLLQRNKENNDAAGNQPDPA